MEHNDMAKTQNDRIGELEAELKQRDARIMQLTKERDQERKLNDEWRDGSNRWQDAVEAWKQRFSRGAPPGTASCRIQAAQESPVAAQTGANSAESSATIL
jgi:hypothetical protein